MDYRDHMSAIGLVLRILGAIAVMIGIPSVLVRAAAASSPEIPFAIGAIAGAFVIGYVVRLFNALSDSSTPSPFPPDSP